MITEVPGISVLPACGFKEWSLVCDALGAGAQSVILRKGGIHEGRGGFWWKHDRFFLFPTHFHEQRAAFTWGAEGGESPAPAEGSGHRLTLFAEVVEKAQTKKGRRLLVNTVDEMEECDRTTSFGEEYGKQLELEEVRVETECSREQCENLGLGIEPNS
jgi:hypothetical protein